VNTKLTITSLAYVECPFQELDGIACQRALKTGVDRKINTWTDRSLFIWEDKIWRDCQQPVITLGAVHLTTESKSIFIRASWDIALAGLGKIDNSKLLTGRTGT